MAANRRLTISRRIALNYTIILLIMLIIFSLIIAVITRHINMENSRDELISTAFEIEDYIESLDTLEPTSFENMKLSYNVFLNVFYNDGKLLFANRSDFPSLENLSRDEIVTLKEERARRDLGIIYLNKIISIQDKQYLLQVARIIDDSNSLGEVLLQVLIFISVLGAALCYLSGLYLSNSMLRPIRNISKAAKEISSASLDKRIPVDGPEDELKDLAELLNSMMERLQADFEKQKRFVADASHELRTPLAVIHGHVNMLTRWGKDDPERLSKSLASLKSETENMSSLIENLLYIAKLDENLPSTRKEVFSLCTLLNEVVEETLLTYSEFQVSCTCDDNLMINKDYNAVKQVIRILVDNSIKFSMPPGKIAIRGEKERQGIRISVLDEGEGIPQECLPYIFDRFYRVDKSRNKATGGTGLGLSIAKQIIQSCNGTISAESDLGKGTKIDIYIPFE